MVDAGALVCLIWKVNLGALDNESALQGRPWQQTKQLEVAQCSSA